MEPNKKVFVIIFQRGVNIKPVYAFDSLEKAETKSKELNNIDEFAVYTIQELELQ